MSRLSEIQSAFRAGVLGAQGGAEALLVGDARGSAAERLAIYADAYHLRLAEVLATDYPVVAGRLGDEGFAALARAYAAAHPSRHPSVRWFGAGLPGFVAATPPWSDAPGLADVAAFERARNDVSDAADDAAATVETVAAIPPPRWPTMRLRMRAAVRRRLDLAWDVAAALRADGDTPAIARASAPVPWLVWRAGTAVRWRSLDAAEAGAFDACAAGASFGEICAALAERADGDVEPAMRAAAFLKQWITDAVVAEVAAD